MGMSDRARQALVNAYLGNESNYGTLSARPTLYIGLSSTQPLSDGTGITEPTGGSYARLTTSSASWGLATLADPSVSSTILLLTFPAPTADWLGGALLPWVVAWDALTVGNFEGWAPVATPRSILNGDAAPIVSIGEGTIELGDEG